MPLYHLSGRGTGIEQVSHSKFASCFARIALLPCCGTTVMLLAGAIDIQA
jgi:hypothetical protein